MKLKAEHLAVLGAASTDPTRLVLMGLSIAPDVVAATDSFCMVAVERLAEDRAEGDFEAILPAVLVKAITSAAKKGGGIEVTTDGNGYVEAKANALPGMEMTWKAARVEGNYPRWPRVFPKGKPIAEVHHDPKLLIKALKVMVRAGGGDEGGVFLRVYADGDRGLAPIVLIRSHDNDTERMVAAIMPMMKDDPADSPWLDKYTAGEIDEKALEDAREMAQELRSRTDEGMVEAEE